MGNCASRCSNTRGKLLPCAARHKRQNEDEPMLSSTYESEAPTPTQHDPHKNNFHQGPCRYPSELLIDPSSSAGGGGEDNADGSCKTNSGVTSSEAQGHDLLDPSTPTFPHRSQRSQSRSPALQSRKSSTTSASTTPKSGRFKFSWRGYRSLRSSSGKKKRGGDSSQTDTKQELAPLDDHDRRLVDTSCQTVILGDDMKDVTSLPLVSSSSSPDPPSSSVGLTKEYIVKTYSIQNATPSPSTNHKFSPSNPIVPSPAARTSSSSLSSSTSSSSKPAASDLHNNTSSSLLVVPPNTPPPAIVEESIIVPDVSGGSLQSAHNHLHHNHNYVSSSSSSNYRPHRSSQATSDGPLACLEQRQLEVVSKLERLKDSVSALAQKYNVSTSPSSSTPSSSSILSGPAVCTPKGLGKCVKDMVISADPSSIPLSLLLVGQQLEGQYSVYRSTFVHSSVAGQVPDSLTQMMTSNGGRSRTSCQLALTLVWKKVSNGTQLVVDPTKQTPIQGEANVVRYLARLLQPAYDDTADILSATQIDDFLDLAQIQILEGNAKEKAAALRSLNSSLGKKDWLVGNAPTIADFVCWSALQQTGQVAAPPANVKKWLSNCNNHESFKTALSLIDVSS